MLFHKPGWLGVAVRTESTFALFSGQLLVCSTYRSISCHSVAHDIGDVGIILRLVQLIRWIAVWQRHFGQQARFFCISIRFGSFYL